MTGGIAATELAAMGLGSERTTGTVRLSLLDVDVVRP